MSKVPALFVEFGYSKGHIEERWKIKVKKGFNIPANEIMPRFNRKRGGIKIKYLVVGRNVPPKEIEQFFQSYLRNKGLLEKAVRIQLTI